MKVTKIGHNDMKSTLEDLVRIRDRARRMVETLDPSDSSFAAGFLISASTSLDQAVLNYGRVIGALDEHWTAK